MDDPHIPRQLTAFETKRLLVRQWALDRLNAQARQNLAQDLLPVLTPDVTQHLPPSFQVPQSVDTMGHWMADRDVEADVFLVRKSVDASLIGLLFFAKPPHAQTEITLHIGYLISQTCWGQGLATELLDGLMTALKPFAPLTLNAGVATANPASSHLLRKLGFTYNETQSTPDTGVYLAQIPDG